MQKPFLHGGSTQHHAFPADHPGVTHQIDAQGLVDLRSVVNDGGLRQPFECRAGRCLDARARTGTVPVRSVPLLCARRGAEHLCALGQRKVDLKPITPDQATRRVHDHRLAAPLRQRTRPNQTQRAFVTVMGQPRHTLIGCKRQIQARMPALTRYRERGRRVHEPLPYRRKILPGFRSPSGSNARLMPRMRSIASSPASSTRKPILCKPMPK